MANEERLQTPNENDITPTKSKKKKKNIFARMGSGIAKWFRELRSELKKVVWPTPKQIVNNSLVAIVVMLASAIVVWGFDRLASGAVQMLISIFG